MVLPLQLAAPQRDERSQQRRLRCLWRGSWIGLRRQGAWEGLERELTQSQGKSVQEGSMNGIVRGEWEEYTVWVASSHRGE